MATSNQPEGKNRRKRVIVRSKRTAGLSDVTGSECSSGPDNQSSDSDVNPSVSFRSKRISKSHTKKETPLYITHVQYPLRPQSVSSALLSHKVHEDSSSTSEGDDDFSDQTRLAQSAPLIPPPTVRPMFLSASHLTPSIYYDTSVLELGNNKKQWNKGRRSNQVAPLPNFNQRILPISQQIPLNSTSPFDTHSTFSSLSSPLSPLLTKSMRKGGSIPSANTDWGCDNISLLESILPDGVLKIFIGSWNMHEEKTLPSCLDDFLLPTSQETAADLYAIGTQESTPNRMDWELLIQQTLGPTHVMIHSVALGMLYLCVFLRRDLMWYCTDVQSSSYATRPVTVIKTKGGVAIHLIIFGSSLLFISSHLTAGSSNVLERNNDIQKITNNITFDEQKGVMESHDHVFWCGDMNYRIELEKTKAQYYIQKSDWMSLLLHDQLTREILLGNIFKGFSEQPIAFPPSYKFDLQSDIYDSSEKARTPSWTDRILFQSPSGGVVSGCGYESCRSIKSSDHRPVYALFRVKLKPLKEVDGVTVNPVGYNRDLYIKGLRRRKEIANMSVTLQQQLSKSNNLSQYRSRERTYHHTSSTICVIL